MEENERAEELGRQKNNDAASRFTFKSNEKESFTGSDVTLNVSLQGRQVPFRRFSGNQGQVAFSSLGFDVDKNTHSFDKSSEPRMGETDRISASTKEVEQSFIFARAPAKETWKGRTIDQSPNTSNGTADNPRYNTSNGVKLRQPFLPSKNRTSQNPAAVEDAMAAIPKFSLQKNPHLSAIQNPEPAGEVVANCSPLFSQPTPELPSPGNAMAFPPQYNNDSIPHKDTRAHTLQRQPANTLQTGKQNHVRRSSEKFHSDQIGGFDVKDTEANEGMRDSQNSRHDAYYQYPHEPSNAIESVFFNSDYGNVHDDHEQQDMDRNNESLHNDAGPGVFKEALNDYVKAHKQEIKEAEDRWRNATMEEWQAGKIELMESLRKIVEMSTTHMKRKLAVYRDIYLGIDDYSRRGVKRQRTLLTVEKKAVERTKELISTLEK